VPLTVPASLSTLKSTVPSVSTEESTTSVQNVPVPNMHVVRQTVSAKTAEDEVKELTVKTKRALLGDTDAPVTPDRPDNVIVSKA